jgi:CheY-like chemotaxis protein
MGQIATNPLRGLRVLIAEDNFLVSELMRQVLIDLECTVIGPVDDVAGALHAIRGTNDIDGALLDVQLGEDDIFPAANALALRGIPFVLTTGRANLIGLPALLANAPLLTKPFDLRGLEDMMRRTFGGGTEGGPDEP